MNANNTFDLLVDFCEYIKQSPYLGSNSSEIVQQYIKDRYVTVSKEERMFFLFKILYTLIDKLFTKKNKRNGKVQKA